MTKRNQHAFASSYRYVNGINTVLSGSIPVLGKLLTPVYFQFFLDKVII